MKRGVNVRESRSVKELQLKIALLANEILQATFPKFQGKKEEELEGCLIELMKLSDFTKGLDLEIEVQKKCLLIISRYFFDDNKVKILNNQDQAGHTLNSYFRRQIVDFDEYNLGLTRKLDKDNPHNYGELTIDELRRIAEKVGAEVMLMQMILLHEFKSNDVNSTWIFDNFGLQLNLDRLFRMAIFRLNSGEHNAIYYSESFKFVLACKIKQGISPVKIFKNLVHLYRKTSFGFDAFNCLAAIEILKNEYNLDLSSFTEILLPHQRQYLLSAMLNAPPRELPTQFLKVLDSAKNIDEASTQKWVNLIQDKVLADDSIWGLSEKILANAMKTKDLELTEANILGIFAILRDYQHSTRNLELKGPSPFKPDETSFSSFIKWKLGIDFNGMDPIFNGLTALYKHLWNSRRDKTAIKWMGNFPGLFYSEEEIKKAKIDLKYSEKIKAICHHILAVVLKQGLFYEDRNFSSFKQLLELAGKEAKYGKEELIKVFLPFLNISQVVTAVLLDLGMTKRKVRGNLYFAIKYFLKNIQESNVFVNTVIFLPARNPVYAYYPFLPISLSICDAAFLGGDHRFIRLMLSHEGKIDDFLERHLLPKEFIPYLKIKAFCTKYFISPFYEKVVQDLRKIMVSDVAEAQKGGRIVEVLSKYNLYNLGLITLLIHSRKNDTPLSLLPKDVVNLIVKKVLPIPSELKLLIPGSLYENFKADVFFELSQAKKNEVVSDLEQLYIAILGEAQQGEDLKAQNDKFRALFLVHGLYDSLSADLKELLTEKIYPYFLTKKFFDLSDVDKNDLVSKLKLVKNKNYPGKDRRNANVEVLSMFGLYAFESRLEKLLPTSLQPYFKAKTFSGLSIAKKFEILSEFKKLKIDNKNSYYRTSMPEIFSDISKDHHKLISDDLKVALNLIKKYDEQKKKAAELLIQHDLYDFEHRSKKLLSRGHNAENPAGLFGSRSPEQKDIGIAPIDNNNDNNVNFKFE